MRAFAIVPDDSQPDTRTAVCEVVVDCHDPATLAEFWSHVVGGEPRVRSEQWATVRDPRPGGLLLAFQQVPEGKVAKNRVHLDIWSDDIAADTARLVGRRRAPRSARSSPTRPALSRSCTTPKATSSAW